MGNGSCQCLTLRPLAAAAEDSAPMVRGKNGRKKRRFGRLRGAGKGRSRKSSCEGRYETSFILPQTWSLKLFGDVGVLGDAEVAKQGVEL